MIKNLNKKNIKFLTLIVAFAVILATQAFSFVAPDPIKIATGARSLALGRANTALNGDINSIYSNPANLSSLNYWQISSMSGKLLDEYNYINISGVYPTKYGNIGVGLVSSSISGAIPTKIEEDSDPSDLIYTTDPSLSSMDYYNNAFLLSYATKVDKISSLPILKQIVSNLSWLKYLNIGSNLKIFNVGLAGGGLYQTSATGTELDFGIYGDTAYSWLSYGVSAQNVLPASLGGKLSFSSGWEETYPVLLKLGVSINLLGNEKAIRSFKNQNLKLLVDVNMEPTQVIVPPLYKIGLEWQPHEMFVVRAGLDQAIAGENVVNNLAAGVGINVKGFQFDYAYHQFQGAYGIDNHFISLAYGLPIPNIENKNKEIDYLSIANPSETSIISSPNVLVSGKVNSNIGSIKIKDVWVEILSNGTFEAQVPVSIGKNLVIVEVYDRLGKLILSKTLKVLRLVSYPDVPNYHWAYDQVNQIGTIGLVKGYPNGRFKPKGLITRAELSALLARSMADKEGSLQTELRVFKDVSRNYWAKKYINLAVNKNIVKGYPKGLFKPNESVTRAEGLAMIARFGEIQEESYNYQIFKDIKSTHWAAKIIAGAYNEGLLSYLRGKSFNPNKKLTRAEAVQMLAQTKIGKNLIDDLLSFDKGYDSSAMMVNRF